MCRERAQQDRSRTKQLELELQSKERSERGAEQLKEQLEGELRAAEAELGNALQQSDKAAVRATEDRVLRETLEDQLATLNDVNTALEQRCNALLRRLELSAGVIQDGHDLKMQLRHAEIDNETLVRSVRTPGCQTVFYSLSLSLSLTLGVARLQIRELKDQHFRREKELKMEIEKALDGKRAVEAHVAELEADVAALRTQNLLFSEWMLVRNENALITKTELLTSPSATKTVGLLFSPSRRHYSSQNQSHLPPSRAGGDRTSAQSGPAPPHGDVKAERGGLYVHTLKAPQSPPPTRSRTIASPVKQVRL